MSLMIMEICIFHRNNGVFMNILSTHCRYMFLHFPQMPKNITKGKALKTLCDLTNLQINNTIAVGDYYNDVEILQNAGLSVCVDNAPDDIKEFCHITVPACTDGGVGHLLAQIINSYI